MPFFRRKTVEKQKRGPPDASASGSGSDLSRSGSHRSTHSLPHSPGTPDSWNDESDIGVPQSLLNGSITGQRRPRSLKLSETVLQDGEDVPPESVESPMRTSSRLSKTLLEVVRDKDALACLKAFLRSQNSEHLIQFWCDAESFHASTLMRRRTHSLQSISKSSIHKRRSGQTVGSSPESSDVGNTSSSMRDHPENINSDVIQMASASNPSDFNYQSQNYSCSRELTEKCASHTDSKEEGLSGVVHKKELTVEKQYSETLPSHNPPLEGHTVERRTLNTIEPSSNINVSNICSAGCATLSGSSHTPDVTSTTSTRDDQKQTDLMTQNEDKMQCLTTSTESTNDDKAQSSRDKVERGSINDLRSPSSETSHEDFATKLKKSIERDAVTIFSTYIAKDAPKPIDVDDVLRSEAISKMCREDGEVDPECFVTCQKFVLDRVNTEYFQGFRDSEFHCGHQVNVLTTERIYLPDILLNENALCYFMEFMEQEGGSDLMQMWLAADNFQQQLMGAGGTYDGEQAQTDAMVIYDSYFSLQATHPLGFDDKLRFEIEGNICREGGPLPDCFTKAKNIVLKILEKMYFPNYTQSQVYYRYLSDLVNTVQMAEDMHNRPVHHKGHRRTESDASSEQSIGSQSTGAEAVSRNTLLAVDTRKLRKVAAPLDSDFSINLDMLNPENLWQRPSAGVLTLGSVNNLGQFVSNFEQDLESEKSLKGLGFFRKRKEKEKEQEEVALRIAQMIISDVNTMTKTGETMTKQDS